MRYEPNRTLKLGPLAWREMIRELWSARELVVRLFLRNMSARHKQAFFGFAWSVIVPVVAIGTFVLLNRAGVLTIGPTGVPYPLFALVGLSVWQFFAGGISLGCQSLVEAGDMIAKVSFPREVLVLAALAQAVFDLLIKVVLIAALCVYEGFLPSASAWLFPVMLLPLVFLTAGLGLLLSLANAVFRDTAQVVGFLTTFLMFLTPVLYPASGARVWLFYLNPLTPLIEAPRDVLLYGHLAHPTAFLVSAAGSLLLFLCAWRMFHLVEAKIPERL